MLGRISFLLVALFWLTMTYFLWRSEYVGETRMASNVPSGLVWKKVLNAPDTSALEIRHHGLKVGNCRWASTVNADGAKSKNYTDEVPTTAQPVGSGFRMDLEGNVSMPEFGNNIRFDMSLTLSSSNLWEDFRLKLNLRPVLWEISSAASQGTVKIVMSDHEERMERILRFSELQNPQTLIDEFNLPPALGLLGAMGMLQDPTMKKGLSLGLDWKARNDWVMIGHTSVRAYRLEAVIFERFRAMILVSRVGELLRVELPDEWELVNEQLVAL